MWSETIGYRDHRPPYLKEFFANVADAIPLTGKEDLLDLGCGVGEVILGFAPFVATLTGLDLEQPMLNETAKRAKAMGRDIRLVHGKVEDTSSGLGRFHLITMGRAHWFMHNPASLARIDQWLEAGGCILVCVPIENPDNAEWRNVYGAVRNKWAKDGILRELTKLTSEEFFHGTDFAAQKRVIARGQRKLELENLILRALGTPATTRAALGSEAERMEADLRAAMLPYFRNGTIMENHVTLGTIYRRRHDS
jgi:cyclopropane fatty-acyl-phospholipid synthase-like methyltransferase